MTATVLFKNRQELGESKEISIEDFVGLYLDYRPLGNMAVQHRKLQADFDSVVYRAQTTGQVQQVTSAFNHYLKLISRQYD